MTSLLSTVNLDVFKMVMENLSTLFFILGILCFIVSVITQITKNLPVLRNVPTDLQVMVLSIGLTVAAFLAYCDMTQFPITWYFVVTAVLIGFVVALVTTKGWNYVVDLYYRFKFRGDDNAEKDK